MPEDRSGESLQIVAHEEDINEGSSVENSAQNEPRRSDCSRDPKAARLPGFPLVPLSANHDKSRERQDGQQERHWTFRKHAQTESRVKREEPESASRRRIIACDKKERQRHRETRHEKHVH